ncbi:MAG TPA: helix-turn-helix domain-containing protein [Crinalium sp.]
MERPDARHVTIETQSYLRQQAIRLRQQGKGVKDISEYLGVHRSTVWEWWWEYEHCGEAGLYQLKRGRAVGHGRILEVEEEEEIRRCRIIILRIMRSAVLCGQEEQYKV